MLCRFLGYHFLLQGIFLTQGSNPGLLHAGRCFTLWAMEDQSLIVYSKVIYIASMSFSSVQPLSHVPLFATPWSAACQASLSITNSQSFLRLMSTELVFHPTILSSAVSFSSCLQSFPASGSFTESILHFRWPNYWGISFSISPFNEYSGLISFKIDWFDLIAVHGTLKSLLQHHSSMNQFFSAQLSL